MICPEDLGAPTKTQEFDDSLLLDSDWIQFLRPALSVLKGNPDDRVWDFIYPKFVEEVALAAGCQR